MKNKLNNGIDFDFLATYISTSSSPDKMIVKGEKVPRAFYIGHGKTGSTSILKGLPFSSVQWHTVDYFKEINIKEAKSYSGLRDNDLYTLACKIGEKYDFKPTIIEAYRDPVDRAFSWVSQGIKTGIWNIENIADLHAKVNQLLQNGVMRPFAFDYWEKIFGADILSKYDKYDGYMSCSNKKINLVFLTLEKRKNWKNAFEKIGIDFVLLHENKSSDTSLYDLYRQAKDSFSLNSNLLDVCYSNDVMRFIYDEDTLNLLKKKWGEGRDKINADMVFNMSGSSKLVYFPNSFDKEKYKALHRDLKSLNDNDLRNHYHKYGRNEGRRANEILGVTSFINLIPLDVNSLEIGCFDNPKLIGENVRYADWLNQNELIDRAKLLNRNPSGVPNIDYVLSEVDLGNIAEKFEVVFSCHVIEHQPDLIKHLVNVENLIENGDRYFLVIPDKRYCFDRFISESTIADVLSAHYEKRSRHTLKSIIEHRAMTTHNDCVSHWKTPNLSSPDISLANIKNAISEYKEQDYVDVHAWQFTPESFARIIQLLNELGFISLHLERLYPTLRNQIEFFAVLKKGHKC